MTKRHFLHFVIEKNMVATLEVTCDSDLNRLRQKSENQPEL